MRKRSAVRVRAAAVGPRDAVFTDGHAGITYIRSPHPLGDYPRCLTDRLAHWAEAAPQRIYLAERDREGHWATLSYAQVYERVQSISQALLERGLCADRPVAILSENGIAHALLGLAALHAGLAEPRSGFAPTAWWLSRSVETG